MKTTDLIPLILYQLVDGDKYGYEIVKQIEDITNGQVVIKQPTLYSVLKKLEQGKFITSYWKDSDIGGKRHYYQLTANGKAQLDTYPPLSTLINDITASGDESTTRIDNVSVEPSPAPVEAETTIKPINLVNEQPITTFNYGNQYNAAENISSSEIDIQSNDVVALEESKLVENKDSFIQDFDPKVQTQETAEHTNFTPINIFETVEASPIAKPSSSNIDKEIEEKQEQFVKDEKVATFTQNIEKTPAQPQKNSKLFEKLSPASQDLFSKQQKTYEPVMIEDFEKINYINYMDFSKDEPTIKRRKALTKNIQKMILSCATLFILSLVCLVVIIAKDLKFSSIYCVALCLAGVILLIYPIWLLINIDNIKLKRTTNPFIYNPKKDLIIKSCLFIIVLIVISAYNLTIVDNFASIFKINNFANIFAPVIMATTLLFDMLYSLILYRQYK